MASSASKRTYSAFAEPNGTSSSSNAKRSNTSITTAPAIAKVELWNMITALSPLTTQTILLNLCFEVPQAISLVQAADDEHRAAERAKPAANFGSYSSDCWYALNRKYKRMNNSKQYEIVGDVCDTLESAREAIMEKAGAKTKWETRRNALEVLRKICKSIMLCDERVIRDEIMKDGIELGYFADAMCKLAKEMSEKERELYKEEGLYEKLVELQTVCDWETDMEGLRELYETFDGPDDGEGRQEDDGSDDSVVEAAAPRRTSVFSVGDLS